MGDVSYLWWFLLLGYPLTVALEAPVLILGLAPRHPIRRRVIAAFWLTACSYPIVVLVLPVLLAEWPRGSYLWVAETFAPLSECLIFWSAFPPDADRDAGVTSGAKPRSTWLRDGCVITVANLVSFLTGEWLHLVWEF